MSLPCRRHAIAMPARCLCHVTVALLEPCYGNVIATSLPCCPHFMVIALPCYRHVIAVLLPRHCQAIAIPGWRCPINYPAPISKHQAITTPLCHRPAVCTVLHWYASLQPHRRGNWAHGGPVRRMSNIGQRPARPNLP